MGKHNCRVGETFFFDRKGVKWYRCVPGEIIPINTKCIYDAGYVGDFIFHKEFICAAEIAYRIITEE